MIVLAGAIKYCLSSFLFTQLPVFTKLVGISVPLCQVQLILANRIQNWQGGTVQLHESVFLGNLFKTK